MLPSELSSKATSHQQEYTWSVDDFPSVLEQAPSLGYACLGGQFWLLPKPGEIYELFWVEADSSDRFAGEPWNAYAERSCREVAGRFDLLLRTVDFRKEALNFISLDIPPDLLGPPVFSAYFVTEQEWVDLQLSLNLSHE